MALSSTHVDPGIKRFCYVSPSTLEEVFALQGTRAISTVPGDFYSGDDYPEQYQGDLFCVDAANGVFRNFSFDAAGNVASVHLFPTGTNVVSQITAGPDEQLYLVELVSGGVARWILSWVGSETRCSRFCGRPSGIFPRCVRFSR